MDDMSKEEEAIIKILRGVLDAVSALNETAREQRRAIQSLELGLSRITDALQDLRHSYVRHQ